MEAPSRRPPRDYFEYAQWPHGTPRPGTPREVLFAAELANSVRRLAWARGLTLDAGMKQLSAETGIGKATLRHVADGTRWTSLYFVAKLEAVVQQPTTGWLLVSGRPLDGASLLPAVDPRRRSMDPEQRAMPAVATRSPKKKPAGRRARRAGQPPAS